MRWGVRGGEGDLYGSITHGHSVRHTALLGWHQSVSVCECVFILTLRAHSSRSSIKRKSLSYSSSATEFHSQSIHCTSAAAWLREVWVFVFVPSKTVINLGNRSQQCIAFLFLALSQKTQFRHCCCQFCHLLGMRPETNPWWKEHEDIISWAAWWIKIIVMPQASAWEENPALFSIRDVLVKKKRTLSVSLPLSSM